MKLGFIGLGVMGRRICLNLIKAGHEVSILSTSGAADELKKEGAILVDTSGELASKVDIIFTCLPDSRIVENTYLEENGVLENAKEGSIFIDLSSITPKSIVKVYEAAQEKNIEVLDGPVSGGATGAENATLTIMIGGKKEIYEKVKPLLEDIGKNIIYIGDSGAGNTLKLVNNLLLGVNMVAVAEAFSLGVKAGIKPEVLYEIISNSSGSSYALTAKYENYIAKGNFDPGFMIDLQHKDLELAVSTAKDLGAPLIIGNLAQQMYEIARAKGMGEKDISAVIKLYEEWLDLEVRE